VKGAVRSGDVRKDIDPSYDPREGLQKQSVLLVKMPTTPDERRFYVKLLTPLHAPFSPS
jgi:Bacterial TniB protein